MNDDCALPAFVTTLLVMVGLAALTVGVIAMVVGAKVTA